MTSNHVTRTTLSVGSQWVAAVQPSSGPGWSVGTFCSAAWPGVSWCSGERGWVGAVRESTRAFDFDSRQSVSESEHHVQQTAAGSVPSQPGCLCVRWRVPNNNHNNNNNNNISTTRCIQRKSRGRKSRPPQLQITALKFFTAPIFRRNFSKFK